jgi:hypothetical protein
MSFWVTLQQAVFGYEFEKFATNAKNAGQIKLKQLFLTGSARLMFQGPRNNIIAF